MLHRKGWLIFKTCLFLRLSYVSIFVQKLAYFEKKPLFPTLSRISCFHLCPEFGLFSNKCCCYLWPNYQGTGLFLVDLKTTNYLAEKSQRFGQTWQRCYPEREIGLTLFCKETKVGTQLWWKFLIKKDFFLILGK